MHEYRNRCRRREKKGCWEPMWRVGVCVGGQYRRTTTSSSSSFFLPCIADIGSFCHGYQLLCTLLALRAVERWAGKFGFMEVRWWVLFPSFVLLSGVWGTVDVHGCMVRMVRMYCVHDGLRTAAAAMRRYCIGYPIPDTVWVYTYSLHIQIAMLKCLEK